MAAMEAKIVGQGKAPMRSATYIELAVSSAEPKAPKISALADRPRWAAGSVRDVRVSAPACPLDWAAAVFQLFSILLLPFSAPR